MNLKKFIDLNYYQILPNSIKSDFGKVLIIGGSKCFVGAPILSSDFAFLSGVGYVSIALPSSIYNSTLPLINKQCIHEHFSNLNDDNFTIFDTNKVNRYNAILFGNGININNDNLCFLTNLFKYYEGILILDASGIDLLAQNLDVLNYKNNKLKLVLTPHLKEASKLFHLTKISRDPKDYLNIALKFAYKFKAYVLLKSYYSILVTPNYSYFVSLYSGIPILSHASSGDLLAGYLSGLLAKNRQMDLKYVIYFGDCLFHLSARQYQNEYNKAILDSKVLQNYILKFIKDNH